MCGNDICQDRRFLALRIPQLREYFHYRNLDVSALKESLNNSQYVIANIVNQSGSHWYAMIFRLRVNPAMTKVVF